MRRRVLQASVAAGLGVATLLGTATPAWAPRIHFGPAHDIADCRGTGWREMRYWSPLACATNADDTPEWLYDLADWWNARLPKDSPHRL
jgi:hypothetical protein